MLLVFALRVDHLYGESCIPLRAGLTGKMWRGPVAARVQLYSGLWLMQLL